MIVKVKKGMDINAIAELFHTTAAQIIEENHLEDARVHAGMRLLVHGYAEYVWLPHDTIEKMALTYGVSKDAIKDANQTFFIGKRIKIPI